MKHVFVAAVVVTTGLLFAVSCSSEAEKPENLLDEDTYINLFIELQLIQTYQKAHPSDSVEVDSLREEVFKKYDISPEQFQQSHEYYRQNLQEQANRMDKAIERLNMDQIQEKPASADTVGSPDS